MVDQNKQFEITRDGTADGAESLFGETVGSPEQEAMYQRFQDRFGAQKEAAREALKLLTSAESDKLRGDIAAGREREAVQAVAQKLLEYYLGDFAKLEKSFSVEGLARKIDQIRTAGEFAPSLTASLLRILSRKGYEISLVAGVPSVTSSDTNIRPESLRIEALLARNVQESPDFLEAIKRGMILQTTEVDAFIVDSTDNQQRKTKELKTSDYAVRLRNKYGLEKNEDFTPENIQKKVTSAADRTFLLSYAQTPNFGAQDALDKHVDQIRQASALLSRSFPELRTSANSVADNETMMASIAKDPLKGIVDFANKGPFCALAMLALFIYGLVRHTKLTLFTALGLGVMSELGLGKKALDYSKTKEAGEMANSAKSFASQAYSQGQEWVSQLVDGGKLSSQDLQRFDTDLNTSQDFGQKTVGQLHSALAKKENLSDFFGNIANIGGVTGAVYYQTNKEKLSQYLSAVDKSHYTKDRANVSLAEVLSGKYANISQEKGNDQHDSNLSQKEKNASEKPVPVAPVETKETIQELRTSLVTARDAFIAAADNVDKGLGIWKSDQERKERTQALQEAYGKLRYLAEVAYQSQGEGMRAEAEAALVLAAARFSGRKKAKDWGKIFGGELSDYITSTELCVRTLNQSSLQLPYFPDEKATYVFLGDKAKAKLENLILNEGISLDDARRDPQVEPELRKAHRSAMERYYTLLDKRLDIVENNPKAYEALTTEQKQAYDLLKKLRGVGALTFSDQSWDNAWEVAKVAGGFVAGGFGAVGGAKLGAALWRGSRLVEMGGMAVGGGAAMTAYSSASEGIYYADALKIDLPTNIASFAAFGLIGKYAQKIRAMNLDLATNKVATGAWLGSLAIEGAGNTMVGFGTEYIRSWAYGYDLKLSETTVRSLAWGLLPLVVHAIPNRGKGPKFSTQADAEGNMREFGFSASQIEKCQIDALRLKELEGMAQKVQTLETMGKKKAAASLRKKIEQKEKALNKDAEAAAPVEPEQKSGAAEQKKGTDTTPPETSPKSETTGQKTETAGQKPGAPETAWSAEKQILNLRSGEEAMIGKTKIVHNKDGSWSVTKDGETAPTKFDKENSQAATKYALEGMTPAEQLKFSLERGQKEFLAEISKNAGKIPKEGIEIDGATFRTRVEKGTVVIEQKQSNEGWKKVEVEKLSDVHANKLGEVLCGDGVRGNITRTIEALSTSTTKLSDLFSREALEKMQSWCAVKWGQENMVWNSLKALTVGQFAKNARIALDAGKGNLSWNLLKETIKPTWGKGLVAGSSVFLGGLYGGDTGLGEGIKVYGLMSAFGLPFILTKDAVTGVYHYVAQPDSSSVKK